MRKSTVNGRPRTPWRRLQNRVVNLTLWLAPGMPTTIPVTCLEARRWESDAGLQFGLGPRADLALRAMLSRQVAEHSAPEAHGAQQVRFPADQGAVWQEIELRQARANVVSGTGALHAVYEEEASQVAAVVTAFPYPAETHGVAIGIGRRVVSLELFDRPITARRLWRRTVEAAVRAWLDYRRLVDAKALPKPLHRFPDRGALGRMTGRAHVALGHAVRVPSVGEGTDVRFKTNRITGGALVRDDIVVHAEVHRNDP